MDLTTDGESLASNVYIVIPAYNEEDSIGDVVSSLRGAWRNIVVIDDGSADMTAARARAAGAIVLRHPINRGQGAALQTGITWSLARGASCIVTFDSDGQHLASDIDRLLAPILSGEADVVLGSRFLGSTEGMPLVRKMILRMAIVFTRLTTGLPVTDAHNGLRAFRRSAADRLHIRLDRMAHASEILDQIRAQGMRMKEAPVHIRYTSYSRQKGQSSAAAVRILLDYLIGRWFR